MKLYSTKVALLLMLIPVLVNCNEKSRKQPQENTFILKSSPKQELTFLDQIDTCSTIKFKLGHKIPAVAVKNLDSIFKAVNKWQDSIKAQKFSTYQIINYEIKNNISLRFYFKIEIHSNNELLEEFNRFCELVSNHDYTQKFIESDAMVKHQLTYYLNLYDVQVVSKFKRFNINFKKYIKDGLSVSLSLSDLTHMPIDSLKILQLKIIDANSDGHNDILINDLNGERIVNQLTDFWIYSKSKNDIEFIKKLSTPIWRIDKKQKIFYSGWHMSADESNSWCFKIFGTKAISQRKCN